MINVHTNVPLPRELGLCLEEDRRRGEQSPQRESGVEDGAGRGAVASAGRAGRGAVSARRAVEGAGKGLERREVAGRVLNGVDSKDHAGAAVRGAGGGVLTAVEPERRGVVHGDVPNGELGRVHVHGHAADARR